MVNFKTKQNFLKKKYAGMTEYFASKTGNKNIYKEEVKEAIKLLNDNNFTFIYGGGSIGLMGVVFDAIKSYNGKITGIIPKILNKKHIRQKDTKTLHVVSSMSTRKNQIIKK